MHLLLSPFPHSLYSHPASLGQNHPWRGRQTLCQQLQPAGLIESEHLRRIRLADNVDDFRRLLNIARPLSLCSRPNTSLCATNPISGNASRVRTRNNVRTSAVVDVVRGSLPKVATERRHLRCASAVRHDGIATSAADNGQVVDGGCVGNNDIDDSDDDDYTNDDEHLDWYTRVASRCHREGFQWHVNYLLQQHSTNSIVASADSSKDEHHLTRRPLQRIADQHNKERLQRRAAATASSSAAAAAADATPNDTVVNHHHHHHPQHSLQQPQQHRPQCPVATVSDGTSIAEHRLVINISGNGTSTGTTTTGTPTCNCDTLRRSYRCQQPPPTTTNTTTTVKKTPSHSIAANSSDDDDDTMNGWAPTDVIGHIRDIDFDRNGDGVRPPNHNNNISAVESQLRGEGNDDSTTSIGTLAEAICALSVQQHHLQRRDASANDDDGAAAYLLPQITLTDCSSNDQPPPTPPPHKNHSSVEACVPQQQ